jgi:hypothetical protein
MVTPGASLSIHDLAAQPAVEITQCRKDRVYSLLMVCVLCCAVCCDVL